MAQWIKALAMVQEKRLIRQPQGQGEVKNEKGRDGADRWRRGSMSWRWYRDPKWKRPCATRRSQAEK